MKRYLLLLLVLVLKITTLAQNQPSIPTKEEPASVSRTLNTDFTVVNTNEIMIKGQKVAYKVTTGTQPVWDETGKPIAGLFYTYYERTNNENKQNRPLLISFNGGPGSASVWMHIAYTGPRILTIDDEGYPVMPYGLKDNPYSVLDVADMVHIDPVNTGFSRITGKDVKNSLFFWSKCRYKIFSRMAFYVCE